MTTCRYSMFAAAQCPKALAWMASLALATGRVEDAEQWVVELIGAVLFQDLTAVSSEFAAEDTRDTLRMS